MTRQILWTAVLCAALGCSKSEEKKEPAKPAEKPMGGEPAKADKKPDEAPKPAAKTMTGEEVAARFKECLGHFSAKDEAKFGACWAEDASSDFMDSGMPVLKGPKEIIEQRAKMLWAAFPDVKVEPQLILVNGGNVVSVDLFTGTNSGDFMGMKATNKKVGLHMAHVMEVDREKGVNVKGSGIMDFATLMGQLGMNPAPVRQVVGKGWDEQKVVVAKDDETERANVDAWKKSTELWNAHDMKAIDIYADDAVVHDMGAPEDVAGRKKVEEFMKGFWAGFTDLKGNYSSVWGAGEYVVAVGSVSGTNDGDVPAMKLKKTGKPVTLQVVEVVRMEGGKVKEHWLFYNGMAMAQQLGLVPPAPGGEKGEKTEKTEKTK